MRPSVRVEIMWITDQTPNWPTNSPTHRISARWEPQKWAVLRNISQAEQLAVCSGVSLQMKCTKWHNMHDRQMACSQF